MTAKWRNKKAFILIGSLILTFMAGASTAYAVLAPSGVDANQFNVTYAGVTAPVDSIPNGSYSMVLTEVDGAISEGQTSQMTVDFAKSSFLGLKLLSNRSCDTSGADLGWCVQAGTQDWAVKPQALLPTFLVDGVTVMWGPGYVREIGGSGMQGLATYRVTMQQPSDPATEGLVLTINVDGFVNKIGGPITPPVLNNYVLNPGFEDGGDHWDRTSHSGRAVIDKQSHTGSRSQRMLASDRWGRLVNQDVPVNAGDSYNASAWVKTEGLDGAGARVELQWLNAAGLPEAPPSGSILRVDDLGPLTGTNGWTELTAAGLSAPPGAVVVRFNLWMGPESDGAGVSWFDDVALLGP